MVKANGRESVFAGAGGIKIKMISYKLLGESI
jgi:hypothetical protein